MLFLDTGYHFPETIGTRDAVSQVYDLDLVNVCLLYTSDAADERSSVDLGGRRIIKKKKPVKASLESLTVN